jgi:hypothetical protein
VIPSPHSVRILRRFELCLLLAVVGGCIPVVAGAASDAELPTKPPVIVIGLVGGWIRHDNHFDRMVQLAARLNDEYGSGVHAEIFENHHREQARGRILQLLDGNRDGTLASDEKQSARIVLYGESWGGSEVVTLARELEERGIPVLLTIQVDSVVKIGENDERTPANVAQAVNFFQPHGIIHGRQEIHPEDSSRTEVLGNFRFDYQNHPVPVHGASWFAKTFLRPHVSIENDPTVWNQIESLIRAKLPAPAAQKQMATDSSPRVMGIGADLP